jgi:conjugal transfer pilus assembly protein TraA
MSAMQVSAMGGVGSEKAVWFKAIMFSVLALALMFLATHAGAATTDEFSAVSTKFEGWVTGSLGKLAAFVALAVGSVVAAEKKDWSWFFGAVVLSIGVGIIVTIVNASFTATI